MVEIWKRALLQPTEETYEWLLNTQGPADFGVAMTRVFSTALVGLLIRFALSSIWFFFNLAGAGSLSASGGFTSLWANSSCVQSILWFLFVTGTLHVMTKFVGGKGTLAELGYLMSIWWVPMMLIHSVIMFVPFISVIIELGLIAFTLYLYALSVKVVCKLEWVTSVGVAVSPLVIVACLFLSISLLAYRGDMVALFWGVQLMISQLLTWP